MNINTGEKVQPTYMQVDMQVAMLAGIGRSKKWSNNTTKVEIFRWVKIEKHSIPNKVATDPFVQRIRSTGGVTSELECRSKVTGSKVPCWRRQENKNHHSYYQGE